MTYLQKHRAPFASLLLTLIGLVACSESSDDTGDLAEESGGATSAGGADALPSSGGSSNSSGGSGVGGAEAAGSGGMVTTGGSASGGSGASDGEAGGGDAAGGDASAGSGASDGEAGGSGGTTAAGGSSGETEFRSSGCDSDGPGLAEGLHPFDLDSLSRRYTLRLPENYDPAVAWPLVLALHPNGGEVGYWDGQSGSRNIRGHLREDAVVIIAEAIGGNWRDYDLPEAQWPDRVDQELGYFDRVIGDAKEQLCIDQRSIFALGFSGGGSFSGVLGCNRTDIRAFAAGGSVIYFDPASCTGNAAAWIVLSEEDDTEDRRAYLDFFAERASCDAADFQEQSCHEYQGCDEQSPVTFCHYAGGHDWPSFGVEDSWEFFSQFIEP